MARSASGGGGGNFCKKGVVRHASTEVALWPVIRYDDRLDEETRRPGAAWMMFGVSKDVCGCNDTLDISAKPRPCYGSSRHIVSQASFASGICMNPFIAPASSALCPSRPVTDTDQGV